MARIPTLAIFALASFTVHAQQPPAPLPPGVVPAGLVTKPAIPVERFDKEPRRFPAETTQAVYSVRAAGAWLVRMNQPDGRFMAGLNPALARPTDGISEMAQAYGAWGCAKVARFTGDDKLIACANQSVLALMTMTKIDGAMIVPTAASEKCNRIGFASLLILAICDLPEPDAKRLDDAEKLGAFLRTQLDDPAGEARTLDPFGAQLYPGHCFQALMALDKVRPEPWKRDAVEKGLIRAREAFKAEPQPMAAGAMLPAAVVWLQRGKNDAVSAFAFEMADTLGACQAKDGGFRVFNGEPGATSAWCLHGLASATQLAIQLGDASRATKYRAALVRGMAFARTLQLADETCQHFEKSFRVRFLLGGMVVSPTDGNLRVDQTAMLALAQLRYLESGAERGE